LTVTRNFRTYSPNHTLRDLRKTFSSNCHEKGISPKVVQKWLGHTNLSMTMNVYTEVSEEFEKEELKKLDK
ncbi:MAG: tyrosine-type recombinase/integrase, partial [Clostridia bacterium]